MLDKELVLEILQNFGFSSTNKHPFIYKKGDTIGICYTFIDEYYGELERVKFFESREELEAFLKKYNWIKDNGKKYNARMALDNYEVVNPKVLFLRNDKVMVKGEMFNIAEFDMIEEQKGALDLAARLILEAGNLLLIYDEMKSIQLEYLLGLVSLKNTLRTKYFDLQKEIDLYNNFEVTREVELLPETADLTGIDENTEKIIKDRYNQYRINPPSVEDAATFLNDVWNLNYGLENNYRFYETQIEENDLRNEIRMVNKKIDYIMGLNDKVGALFKKDLVKGFKNIEKHSKSTSVEIPANYVQNKTREVEKKYSYLNDLSIYHLADYLKEAMNNTNYDDLVLKYPKEAKDDIRIVKMPMNEVAIDLFKQYKEKLSVEEQAIMILYNSKYRNYFENILSIKDFDTLKIKKVIKKLNSVKGFSKIKSDCFDAVKARIDDPCNAKIKEQLFTNIDFTDYNTFVKSMVDICIKLKNMEYKLILPSDIKMYYGSSRYYYIYDENFRLVTNDLNGIIDELNVKKDVITIVLLKKDIPLLYSPYYLDFGDLYNKVPNLQMYIKEMVNFDLLINLKNVDINKDPESYKVARYYSDPVIIDEVSVVEEVKLKDNLTFNRVTFSPKNGIVNIEGSNQVNGTTNNQQVVEKKDVKPVETKVVKTVVKRKEKEEVKNV